MIRICKDRDSLKQYLSSKEMEVVMIMEALLLKTDGIYEHVLIDELIYHTKMTPYVFLTCYNTIILGR